MMGQFGNAGPVFSPLIPERRGGPLFFVSVASKGLSQAVSLLFATLAVRSISVAAKGLRAIVDSGQWTGVTGQKKRGWGMGNPSGSLERSRGHGNGRGERSARVERGKHGTRIARGYQLVKYFAVNGGN